MKSYLIALAIVLLGACAGEHRDARDKYNEGVAALIKGDHDAAEKALTDARGRAGVDPDLLFRAAYDLGIAYGGHADKVRNGQDADLEQALQLADQAVTWLQDARRLRPDDADAKANLEIMLARRQAITDELARAGGKLEARLDALIGAQRGVLEGARGAWQAIKQSGGSDPLAQQPVLGTLADRERGLGADAGVIGDLTADEIDQIGKKPDDKRSDEEKVRVTQLKALDMYLLQGRTRLGEARTKLQALVTDEAIERAEAAMVAFKRAREQLLDPIQVIQRVAQDETEVLRDTSVSEPGDLKAITAEPAAQVSAWITPAAIAQRQLGIRDRLQEVRERLTAATQAPPPDPAKPVDAKQAKLLERITAALPAVGEASTAMDHARDDLLAKQIKPALEQEQDALDALARAIEQFSDLKQLIELAYAEHQQLVQLLGPEAAKQLAAAERGKLTRQALGHNLGRMPRLRELIADEVTQLEDKAKQAEAGAGAGSAAADPKAAEARKAEAKQQLDQARQQLARAEELRGQAQTALDALDKAITANHDPMPPARDADAKLAELRKLFFSVIEHLKELIREQGETHDQTSAANADDDFTRQPKLPGLVERQDGHGKMAKAITDALAAQADAAAKQAPPASNTGPTTPHQGPDPKALAGAADEVRQGQTDMGDALANLTKARDAKASSESLDPGVKSQAKAIEHLEAALKLLQPPPKKNDQKDQDKQQQDKPEQDKKQDQPQQPQGGAGQRARDEDAKRQHDRNRADGAEPVEKDW